MKRETQKRRPKGMRFGWAPHPFRSKKKGESRCELCGLERNRNDMHTNRKPLP